MVYLQNKEALQYLKMMNNALRNGASASALMSGRISALENELKYLASAAGDNVNEFNRVAKELQNLKNIEAIAGEVSSAFNQMFDAIIDGGQNMGDVLKDIFKSILKQIAHMIIQAAVMKAALAITGNKEGSAEKETAANLALAGALGLASGAEYAKATATMIATKATQTATTAASQLAVANAAAAGAWVPFPGNIAAIASGIGAVVAGIASGFALVAGTGQIAKLAEGGIVPKGYPNDSFPAMLSSNEAVIPLDNLKDYGLGEGGQVAILEGEVRFEIEGDRLIGILKKQGIKNSLY